MATKKAQRTQGESGKATGRASEKGRRAITARAERKGASGEAGARKRSKGTTARGSRPQPVESPRVVRDPRLPEAGTVLRKVDRQGSVRCECTV